MSVAQELPVAYEEVGDPSRDPIVTLIGSDLPPAYLDDAEPSPLMEGMSRMWQRIINTFKLGIIAALVGGYPAAMVLSHKVDSSPITTSDIEPWASPEIGAMLTMIGRELTGPSWSGDRPNWHPQSRLTALPAWQNGLANALSQYAGFSASIATSGETDDADLLAAARLLAPQEDAQGIPRLNAAAEALQRYDGRLSRGFAVAPAGNDSLQQELDLFTGWASNISLDLGDRANRAEAWPASRADIEAIYNARAYAHVAGQLLAASLQREPDLIADRDTAEIRDAALAAWTRAANFNPVFISSQAGNNRFLSDHPATMAFYMAEAETATSALQQKLVSAGDQELTVAAATE